MTAIEGLHVRCCNIFIQIHNYQNIVVWSYTQRTLNRFIAYQSDTHPTNTHTGLQGRRFMFLLVGAHSARMSRCYFDTCAHSSHTKTHNRSINSSSRNEHTCMLFPTHTHMHTLSFTNTQSTHWWCIQGINVNTTYCKRLRWRKRKNKILSPTSQPGLNSIT